MEAEVIKAVGIVVIEAVGVVLIEVGGGQGRGRGPSHKCTHCGLKIIPWIYCIFMGNYSISS